VRFSRDAIYGHIFSVTNRKYRRVTRKEIAESFSMSAENLSAMLEGRRVMTPEQLRQWLQIFSIEADLFFQKVRQIEEFLVRSGLTLVDGGDEPALSGRLASGIIRSEISDDSIMELLQLPKRLT